MKLFGSLGIKQGIKYYDDDIQYNITKNIDSEEYEEYIDPNCGCKKIRIKNTNKSDLNEESIEKSDSSNIKKSRKKKQ